MMIIIPRLPKFTWKKTDPRRVLIPWFAWYPVRAHHSPSAADPDVWVWWGRVYATYHVSEKYNGGMVNFVTSTARHWRWELGASHNSVLSQGWVYSTPAFVAARQLTNKEIYPIIDKRRTLIRAIGAWIASLFRRPVTHDN